MSVGESSGAGAGGGAIGKQDKIFVAGHRGLVGSALCSALLERGYRQLVTRGREELDLRDSAAVAAFYERERPDVVFVAAARVGGILANSTYGADFLYENLQIQNSLIWGAHVAGVRRLVFLGSSCIYPREAPSPISELALLSGPLEPTNRPYALAKIAGLELVQSLRRQYGRDYFSVMPTNLYGPGDRYMGADSHVIPGLVQRFFLAKQAGDPEVVVWGSGRPRREFMYARDCAAAIVLLAERLDEAVLRQSGLAPAGWSHVNVGSGEEVTIAEVAEQIAAAVGYQGRLRFDPSKPDGTPRKLVDSSVLRSLGFRPETALREGLTATVQDYLQRAAHQA